MTWKPTFHPVFSQHRAEPNVSTPFRIGELIVRPGVTGGHQRWTAHYSITTPDVSGDEQGVALVGVPGLFPTQEEAMTAASEAGHQHARVMNSRNAKRDLE